jgi:hypothetical protein
LFQILYLRDHHCGYTNYTIDAGSKVERQLREARRHGTSPSFGISSSGIQLLRCHELGARDDGRGGFIGEYALWWKHKIFD